MLWKILSVFSALALAVGLWFSYQMQGALQEERKLASRATQNLQAVQQEFAVATEAKEAKAKELVEVEKQRDEVKAEIAKANTDIDDKTKELETVNANLTEVKKQVAELKEQIDKAGDIQKLLAQVKDLTEQKTAAEAAVANRRQQVALAEERVVSVQSQIRRLQEVESLQKRGIVDKGFTARVSQSFPELGFVVLNKGNQGGMFANALLDVKRGSSVVAKLKVRDVEQRVSVADLIPGSMAAGNTIRSGDLVVATADQPSLPPPPAPAAAGEADAADGEPAAAPMSDDPFGGAVPMPPPGAPEAPMTAPDPAAAPADPFAPADGAMAPADGGAMAPAEADPFAPAPPAGDAMMGQ